jgi:myo-inositol-1(or 4)-monophosphatase
MKQILTESLTRAGEILLENFEHLTGYEIKESQSSIVTKADIDSEKAIIQMIQHKFPTHNTLGEETGFQNRGSEFTWVIDPLDGTSNFAAGIPWFGVIICLLKNSAPVLSGCYLPVQDLFYLAEKGKGATCNGKKIAVSEETNLKNVLVAYSLDYSEEKRKTEQETKLIGRLVNNCRNLRSTNSVVDFCYTAEGKLGGCMNQSTKIWDIAGPVLLIEEAGGKATDINGNPFDFKLTDENYKRNFTIIASNEVLHRQLTQLKEEKTKSFIRFKLRRGF